MGTVATEKQARQQYVAEVPMGRVDDGLFGPGSAPWKIWADPAMLVGITRSFVLDMVGNTQGAAAMEEHSFYRQDPLGRLRRTVHYFYAVVYGDSSDVAAANLRLDRLHQRIVGTDPMTGQAYSALDPYLRLGTQLNTWHSVYYAYEKLGGRPTQEEEREFFEASAVASEAMGIDPADALSAARRHGIEFDADRLPRTRAEYRIAWEAARHCVCVNAQTRRALQAILRPEAPDRHPSTLVKFLAYPLIGRVALALIPVDIRRTCGLPASRIGDAVALSTGGVTVRAVRVTRSWNLLFKDLCRHAYEVKRAAGQP
jgi:uncharacterized protein (DUF2236 family)